MACLPVTKYTKYINTTLSIENSYKFHVCTDTHRNIELVIQDYISQKQTNWPEEQLFGVNEVSSLATFSWLGETTLCCD